MSADYIIKNDLQLRINEYSHKLNGKVVIITGAASGIGRMATLDYVKYGLVFCLIFKQIMLIELC